MLSRKYVNVHACPVIRSSRSLSLSLSLSFRSLLHSRSLDRLFSSVHPYTSLCLVEPRSIDPRARESRIHVVATIRALPCLGNEKTIDSTMLRPRGRSKRKVRRENTRRGSERGARSFLLIPLKASLHGFALHEQRSL